MERCNDGLGENQCSESVVRERETRNPRPETDSDHEWAQLE